MCSSVHVVVAHHNENLDWIHNIKYPVTVISRQGIPEGTAPNISREASSYLEYIIKNYNSLPEYVVFVHGHRNNWHHRENMDETINRLNFYFDYCNINDSVFNLDMKYYPGERKHVLENKHIFERIFNVYIDIDNFTHKQSAQFYVKRDAILSRTLEQYKELYDYSMSQNANSSRVTAVVFERFWHFIFTNNTIDKNLPLV